MKVTLLLLLLVLLSCHSHAFWHHQKSRKEFRFEDNKLLLFTIKNGIGVEAYPAYVNKDYSYMAAPTNGKLPDVYRSYMLDNLPHHIGRTGRKYIVAEMRNNNNMAARVVFDVSDADVNLHSWFVPYRVVHSYPYDIRKQTFNFFAITGYIDSTVIRRFFINNAYPPGCHLDIGFWAVMDKRDICPYGQIGWKGASPALVYSKLPGVARAVVSAPAERFLIYMA